MMRILQYNLTTTTKQGGVETFVWELSRELAARGHAVTILGGAAAGTDETILRHTLGVRVLRAPFLDRRVWQALPPLRRAYAIVKLLERLSLLPGAVPLATGFWDVVHIHKPYDLPLFGLLRRRVGRTVYHGHGGDFYPGDQQLMRLADTLLSCSAFNANQLREHYGRDASVVFNGYDTAHFVPHPPDLALRAQLARPDEPLLVYAGRLMPWKGVAHLIGGLAKLHDTRARLLVLMANDAPAQRAELLQLAHQSGVAQRVTFAGPVAHRELPRYYALADLVVAASYASETFGMALLEAMGCGRAVVASRFGGFSEVVADGETGLLFPPRDEAAFAVAADTLLHNSARREAMGRAGQQRARDHFSWQAVADRVERAYEAR